MSSFNATSGHPQWTSHRGDGQFASVVGEFQHEVTLQGGQGEPHARFDMNVSGQQYEADINVHSMLNPDGTPGGSPVEYAEKDEIVPSMPAEGEHDGVQNSYAASGLTAADFKTVSGDTLHQHLMDIAGSSERIELLGKTYHDANKNGIHDIHANSGNDDASRDDPNHDGVARFYSTENGQIHQKSIYVMFQSQHLPGAPDPSPPASVA